MLANSRAGRLTKSDFSGASSKCAYKEFVFLSRIPESVAAQCPCTVASIIWPNCFPRQIDRSVQSTVGTVWLYNVSTMVFSAEQRH